MIVKVNVSVRPKSYKGSFIVKLLEVDMFEDDVLARKVQHLYGDSMGYLRDRNLPEVVHFEFFISLLHFQEMTAELKAVVYGKEGEMLGQSDIFDFNLLSEVLKTEAKTIELSSITI